MEILAGVGITASDPLVINATVGLQLFWAVWPLTMPHFQPQLLTTHTFCHNEYGVN